MERVELIIRGTGRKPGSTSDTQAFAVVTRRRETRRVLQSRETSMRLTPTSTACSFC